MGAFKEAVKKLPGINRLVRQRDQVNSQLVALQSCYRFAPPGHFYSPIPALDDVRRDEAAIFDRTRREVPGIDLREEQQLELLEQFKPYYRELPFPTHQTPGLRYWYENPAYSYSDAIFLYCMIRHLKPKRLIEIGSGFSSSVTLDTNELFFGGAIATTFIEPYPEVLLKLAKPADHERMKLIPQRLQDVALEEFDALQANDILFIDSTHVSKVASDVNRIFFEILPRLAPGVHIHIHDVFYPFEYPQEWIYEGRCWTEAYLLKAFLQYNANFRIVLMNTFLERFHEPFFQREMPLCLKNPGGSIWLAKQDP